MNAGWPEFRATRFKVKTKEFLCRQGTEQPDDGVTQILRTNVMPFST
jgi:hypothetical protein